MASLKVDSPRTAIVDPLTDVAEETPAAVATVVVPPPPPAPIIWGQITKVEPTPSPDTSAAVAASTGSVSTAWVPRRASAVTANHNVDKFVASSPDAQRAELTAMKAERDALGGRVQTRVAQLDAKWNSPSLRTWTKVEALRHYHEKTQHLREGPRQELDKVVAKSEGEQRTINDLRAKADGMCRPEACTPAEQAERDQVAAQLAAARRSQAEAVVKATDLVDNQGLRVERLAITEQIIDPEAPAEGLADSLMSLVDSLFDLSEMVDDFVERFEERAEERIEKEAIRKEAAKKDLIKQDTLRRTFRKKEDIYKHINANYLKVRVKEKQARGNDFFG